MVKALAIAAIALLAQFPLSCGDSGDTRYRNTQAGWTISYPKELETTVVDIQGFVSLNGVAISNFKGITARRWLEFQRFPDDGVAFIFLIRSGGPAPDTEPPEARFPLSPANFRLSRGTQRSAPEPLALPIVANGLPYTASVWFGPKSSSAARETIWSVVRSLRFPPQKTRTMSGYYYVLEDASHYPVDSVVRFDGRPSSYVPPFFLVHAPRGFYAVSWQPKFEPTCNMGFNRPKLEFYCRTSRGRWDRMGHVLEGPNSAAQYNDSLDLAPAKIGRDGQVLVGDWRTLGDPQYARYERRFWPPDS